MESVCGTHLGHNLPDFEGARYCIDLVCIAGKPAAAVTTDTNERYGDFNKDNFVSKANNPGTELPTWFIWTISLVSVGLFLIIVGCVFKCLRQKRQLSQTRVENSTRALTQ